MIQLVQGSSILISWKINNNIEKTLIKGNIILWQNFQQEYFGVTSDVSGLSQGIIANSLTFNDTVETAEARNEKGEIIDIAAYSKGTTVDIQGVYTGEGVKAGKTITIGEDSYLVTTVSRTESNTAFQEGSVSARRADNATLHPIEDATA